MFLCVDRYVYMLDTLLIVFFTYTGIDNPGVCYGFQSKPSGYLKISLYKCILWAIVFSCFVLSIIIFLHLSFSGYRLGNKKKTIYKKNKTSVSMSVDSEFHCQRYYWNYTYCCHKILHFSYFERVQKREKHKNITNSIQ